MHEPDYDIRGLQEGIDKCKKNIKTFEQAIDNERDTIASYRKMIDTLERKQALEEGIVIDANAID